MLLALLACVAQVPTGSPAPPPAISAKIIERIGVILQYAAFVPDVDFSTWPQVAWKHRKDIDGAQTAQEYADQIGQALEEYGVSHIGIAPPGRGIGVAADVFGFDTVEMDGRWVVTRVFAGTQAEKAGLHSGLVLESKALLDDDTIVLSFYDETHVLRAKSIHKQKVVPKIEPKLTSLDKTASVLEIGDFGTGYDHVTVQGLLEQAMKTPYLILDLRGNVGGYPGNAADLLGYFMAPGTRFGAAISKDSLNTISGGVAQTTRERASVVQRVQGSDVLFTSLESMRYTGHLAVLIDGGTRSTGELAALALRDFDGAQIFGTPSAGQVLAMNRESLPGGYTLYFPWRDYWTAKGERIEGNPIVPDNVSTVGSEEASPMRTPLWEHALRWLRLLYPLSGS